MTHDIIKCSELTSNSDISLKDISPIDCFGLIYSCKCPTCNEGYLQPVNIETNASNCMALNSYLSDFGYSMRFLSYMYRICVNHRDKYDAYFDKHYGCKLHIYKGRMPYLGFKITNNEGVNEAYKLYIVCEYGQSLMGRLYRDYGMNAKGILIHNFKLSSDADIIKVFDNVMSYIRSNLKDI